MKTFTVILQIIFICLLCQCDTAKSKSKRKWLEIGQELFLVDPEDNYTWKEAVAECQKEHSNLVTPKGDYDYAKLKDVIKWNFNNYSSFWTSTQVKWTTIFQQIGLGRDQHNRQKCHKFDNSTMFKFLPENCDTHLGFICEKSLLNGYSSFNTKNMVYLVQPDQEFTCEQAYDQCDKRHMSLLVLKDHASNKLLKNYIFINYGSNVGFWFSYNNETHYNCATYRRGQLIKNNSKLGFICQRVQPSSRSMSMRHMILLIFVALAAFLAVIMFVVVKCCCSQKVESCNLPEGHFAKEHKVTDIK